MSKTMERNISYLNAKPLEKLKVLAMGEAINAQQGFVESVNNPATLAGDFRNTPSQNNPYLHLAMKIELT